MQKQCKQSSCDYVCNKYHIYSHLHLSFVVLELEIFVVPFTPRGGFLPLKQPTNVIELKEQ